MTEGRAFIDTEHPGRPGGSDGRGGGAPGSLMAAVGFVGLPLLAGAVGSGASMGALGGWYRTLAMPPGMPPDWAFGVVWTVLYVLMGMAAWLVWRVGRRVASAHGEAPRVARALRVWGWQLLLNAAWGPAFFGMHSIVGGLVVMVPLLGLVAATTAMFLRVRRLAGVLMLPYVAWTCYAAYLNVGFWWLNRS